MQIAASWFERKIIGGGLTLLWEPHAHPLLRCNIWHRCGRDRDLLVDSGLGVASLRSEIADLIDKPLLALATHIHYDHVGSLHEFESRLMHRIEAPRMADYREFCPLVTSEFPREILDQLAESGYTIDADTLIDALPTADFEVEGYGITSTETTRELEEGDVVDLGDRHFEVFHLPGHSPGSIGLWDASSGIFFSGDAIYDGPLLDDLPDSDIEAYLRTMQRLRELPVSVVHGGHEPSFGRERLVELADAYIESRQTR